MDATGRALLAAIAADPADDLARLVYADYREDAGAADYARFVREQVRLDPLPDWHPDRVRAKYRDPGVLTGTAFARELPTPPGRAWEWPATGAFRRGLPYAVVVRDLTGFLDTADDLFEHYPVGELRLPTSTLDEWRRFAGRPWLPRVERVRFYGVSTPIEPLRVLSDAPNVTGLTALALEKAGGPAVPVLLADLFDAPLGRRLTRLELHAGADQNLEWLDALAGIGDRHALAELSLVTMGVTADAAGRLVELSLAPGLRGLELRNNPLGGAGVRALVEAATLADLERLRLHRVEYAPTRPDEPAVDWRSLTELRGLELSDNPLYYWEASAGVAELGRLASLALGGCRLRSDAVFGLTSAAFWPTVAELDLRGNPLGRLGLWQLVAAPDAPCLTALVLDAAAGASDAAVKLRDKYGDAVVFTDAE